jgi:hypothetical protein
MDNTVLEGVVEHNSPEKVAYKELKSSKLSRSCVLLCDFATLREAFLLASLT